MGFEPPSWGVITSRERICRNHCPSAQEDACWIELDLVNQASQAVDVLVGNYEDICWISYKIKRIG